MKRKAFCKVMAPAPASEPAQAAAVVPREAHTREALGGTREWPQPFRWIASPPPVEVIGKNTAIVNPPAKSEKTIIVNPPTAFDSRRKNDHDDRDKSVGDLRRQPLLRKSSLSVWPRAPRTIPLDELDHGAGAARIESMNL